MDGVLSSNILDYVYIFTFNVINQKFDDIFSRRKTLIAVTVIVMRHIFWTPLLAGNMLVASKINRTPPLKHTGGVRYMWDATNKWDP
jgi:hypothetical protein